MLDIFTKLKQFPDAELENEYGNLFCMERTVRQGDVAAFQALEPANTVEAMFKIYCAERLGIFYEELERVGAGLFSILTKYRTCTLLESADFYGWLLERVDKCTNTEFDELLDQLSILSKGTIKSTSRAYKVLMGYGFADTEIFYLNYCLYYNSASTTRKRELTINCVNAFGQKSTELLDVEKALVIKLLEQLQSSPWGMPEDAFEKTEEIELDVNWEWFYSLVPDYLPITCKMLRVYPSIAVYKKRFDQLRHEDKFIMVSYNLVAFQTKESFLDMLAEFDLMDYLDHVGKYDHATVKKLLELGVISLNDLEVADACHYVEGIPTTEALLWVHSHLDDGISLWNCLSQANSYYHGFYQLDGISWDSFDLDDNKFLGVVQDFFFALANPKASDGSTLEVYKDSCYLFYSLLKSEKFQHAVGTDTMRELCTLFRGIRLQASSAYLDEIESALYTEEELKAMNQDREEQEEKLNAAKREQEVAEINTYLKSYFKRIRSIQELISKYNEYSIAYFSFVDEAEYLDNYVLKRLRTYSKKGLGFSYPLMELLYTFLKRQRYSFQEYKNIINCIVEKEDEEHE